MPPKENENLFAVVDIGAISLRLLIASLHSGKLKTVDYLYLAVALGKDTFHTGFICDEITARSITALKNFRTVLDEYHISDKNIFVMATSAVMEASNRDFFVDRVNGFTGFSIYPVEPEETLSFIYLSYIVNKKNSDYNCNQTSVLAEISSGNSLIMSVAANRVTHFHTAKTGTLRESENIDLNFVPAEKQKEIAQSHMEIIVQKFLAAADTKSLTNQNLHICGSDIPNALLLTNEQRPLGGSCISLEQLDELAGRVASIPVSQRMKKLSITSSEAESQLFAVLAYLQLAKQLKAKKIILSSVSIRHGALIRHAMPGFSDNYLLKQVMNSAKKIGRNYKIDTNHSQTVMRFAEQIYKSIPESHFSQNRGLLLLKVASWLHDCGKYINNKAHHKHSAYIISNAPLFGLSKREKKICAQIARYHRKAHPNKYHTEYNDLSYSDRMMVNKMAAILRVADALDSSDTQHISKIELIVQNGLLVVVAFSNDSIFIEKSAMKEKSELFKNVFGLKVILKKKEAVN